jgi:hypothetical protein
MTADDIGRVTAFAVQADGSRSFAVTVGGLRVLVTADDERHDDGNALAATIAGLGPETLATSDVKDAAPAKPGPKPPAFVVGQVVWCKVHGSEGEYIVAEVGTGRRAGEIKVRGFHGWCPRHNFREVTP